MARCPRCLRPVDEEQHCLDPHCGDRVAGSSLRPLAVIFALVGMVHLALVWRLGVPAVEPPAPPLFWVFVAMCWLLVNGTTAIVIYAAWVYAFEVEGEVFTAWILRATTGLRAMIRGAEPLAQNQRRRIPKPQP